MDRYLISGATLLLIGAASYLLVGLDDAPLWLRESSGPTVEAKLLGDIERTENNVRRRGQNTLVWNESKSDDQVFERDSILTLASSSAKVRLSGETTLNLEENTLVVLEPSDDSENGTLRIRFSRGSLRSYNPSQALSLKGETFTVSADRGTSLSLVGLEDGKFEIEIEKGQARLSSGTSSDVIKPGEKLLLDKEGIREKKSTTANLKWLTENPTRVYSASLPMQFTLKWQGRAEKIRIINADKKRSSLEIDQSRPSQMDMNFSEGVHYLSLETGLETSRTLMIQVRPAPRNKYYSPLPRNRVPTDNETTFAWEPIAGATQYRLEISQDPEFNSVYKSLSLQLPYVKLKLDDEAKYFWRVSSSDLDGNPMPSPRSYPIFVVPNPFQSPETNPTKLQAPEKREPADESSRDFTGASFSLWRLLLPLASAQQTRLTGLEAVFSWQPIAGADHYVIEISSTPGFENPFVIETVNSTKYIWKNFKRGRYFWRVAAGLSAVVSPQRERLGVFSSVAIVDLQTPGEDPGEGVHLVEQAPVEKPVITPQYVREPDKPAKPIQPPANERVDQHAPMDRAVARVEPLPVEQLMPEDNKVSEMSRSSTSLGEAISVKSFSERSRRRYGRFIYRPHFHQANLNASGNVEAKLSGIVEKSFSAELYIPRTKTESIGRIEQLDLVFDYSEVKWQPKSSPLQRSMIEQRWALKFLLRPLGKDWVLGPAIEGLPVILRKSSEETDLRNLALYGVSGNYTWRMNPDNEWRSEIDFGLDLRYSTELMGARVKMAWQFHLANFWSFNLEAGPSVSFEEFKGSEIEKLSAHQAGFNFGLSW